MSKKGAVIEEGKISLEELENALPSLSAPVLRRVNALINIHEDYLVEFKNYQKEVRALEEKYAKEKFASFYQKRATIITGQYEPTDDECRIKDEELPKSDSKDAEEEKGIPSYWLMAMKNNSLLGSQITDEDEDALSYLTDISTSSFESEKEIGFDLSFHFATNPYFTDTVLTKKYVLEEEEMFGELVLNHVEGSKINWKPSKNLTVKVIKKKVAGRGGKGRKQAAPRSVTVEEPCDSFFNFFSPPVVVDDDEEDEELREQKEMLLELDFDMASKFKDSIIPFSVLWFTGDAAEYGEFDEGFSEEDEEDEEEEDDEDEDEDEEEDEAVQPKGRGARGGARGGKQGGSHNFAPPSGKQSSIPPPQQPECKQQ